MSHDKDHRPVSPLYLRCLRMVVDPTQGSTGEQVWRREAHVPAVQAGGGGVNTYTGGGR